MRDVSMIGTGTVQVGKYLEAGPDRGVRTPHLPAV